MYDVAIIGTGAAGISAALTLKNLNKNFIWLGSKNFSPKISKAEKISNYPGLPDVTGAEMAGVFTRQVLQAGIEITEKTVTGVYKMKDHYSVMCNMDVIDARAVILATGVESVKPIPGELEFLGRGVSYCATCDGALYRGKTILVVCTEKELEHEIEFLASLAAKVYVVALYKGEAFTSPKIEKVGGMPVSIEGNRRVERVIFHDKEIAVDGVFMLKAAVTPDVLVSGLDTENGHVKIDRQCVTNLAGLFAAGDCTGRPYQYAKAVGEGNVAAHSANDYLGKLNKE